MSEIASLQSKIDEAVAGLGQRVEAGVIAIRADEKAKAHIAVIDTAMNVRDKINKEYDKQNRADTPPVFDVNDRTLMLQRPGFSASRVKTLKKMEERLKRLETDLNAALASHATTNTTEIENAYTKLAKTTEEVSKGADDTKSNTPE
jgi:hypothetical protein